LTHSKTQDLGNKEEYPTPEDQIITLYGIDYDTKYPYRLHNDTLRIRHLGGFEFYDEYFVRLLK
jgi:hypothetical protein